MARRPSTARNRSGSAGPSRNWPMSVILRADDGDARSLAPNRRVPCRRTVDRIEPCALHATRSAPILQFTVLLNCAELWPSSWKPFAQVCCGRRPERQRKPGSVRKLSWNWILIRACRMSCSTTSIALTAGPPFDWTWKPITDKGVLGRPVDGVAVALLVDFGTEGRDRVMRSNFAVRERADLYKVPSPSADLCLSHAEDCVDGFEGRRA